jgi:hypothetical protein
MFGRAVIAFALLISVPAVAGERGRDKARIAEDRRETAADVVDKARLDRAIDAWNTAVAAKDAAGEKAADADLSRWVRQEMAETHVEVVEDRHEVRASAAEAAGPGRDDQRDLAGDRADLERERRDRARTHEIAAALRDLQPAFDAGTATPEQYGAKGALLKELKGLAWGEVRRDNGERREDRRELREDRRHR